MVLQLLSLGRFRAQQRSAGDAQVRTQRKKRLVDEKILLLGADGGDHPVGFAVAEQLQYFQRRTAQRLHGAQQRRFFIQRFTGVADKDRGDAEDAALGSFHDERRTGGVPHSVAARLKGGAHAAAGERGGVGFALHQLLAAEPFQSHALFINFDKGVMLFRGQSGLRLKPVGEMRDALAQGPFLHGVGHHVGDGHVQLFAFADGGAQFFVHILGHLFAHHLLGKAVDAINLGARHGLRRIVYFIISGDGQ